MWKQIICKSVDFVFILFADKLAGEAQIMQTLKLLIIVLGISSVIFILQVWHVADAPQNDKFEYTYFAHKLNSFDTAPRKLLASDSRLRPDRYALEMGDMSKAGAEKSRSLTFSFIPLVPENMADHSKSNTHIILSGSFA